MNKRYYVRVIAAATVPVLAASPEEAREHVTRAVARSLDDQHAADLVIAADIAQALGVAHVQPDHDRG